jgi:hypothetical protein
VPGRHATARPCARRGGGAEGGRCAAAPRSRGVGEAGPRAAPPPLTRLWGMGTPGRGRRAKGPGVGARPGRRPTCSMEGGGRQGPPRGAAARQEREWGRRGGGVGGVQGGLTSGQRGEKGRAGGGEDGVRLDTARKRERERGGGRERERERERGRERQEEGRHEWGKQKGGGRLEGRGEQTWGARGRRPAGRAAAAAPRRRRVWQIGGVQKEKRRPRGGVPARVRPPAERPAGCNLPGAAVGHPGINLEPEPGPGPEPPQAPARRRARGWSCRPACWARCCRQ